ncbi:DUF1667 domain-containing protein [Clostridium gasigenes]|uniref:CxxC motif-containing protein n=1 Tax=Clostridium gasigenes TaxID=94869 RepID=A0A1H0NRP2_9CLOT|nr:DUF1667 domain-containing protein [Clostridium gasigenes]SDO95462.1 CxxC motif-containing protein [Clostridium gasigenes]
MENKKIICIVCPNGCELYVKKLGEELIITGNKCSRGKDFAINEMIDPKRSISSTVKTIFENMPRLPVRTDTEISKERIIDLMKVLSNVLIDKPIRVNDVIVENVLDSGVNVISTSDLGYENRRTQ